jgi:hypothetical protein
MESLSLVSLISGIVGTSAMLAFLYFLSYAHAIESRLPLALGAILLRRMEGALPVGLAFHYAFGIAWGFIYVNLIVLAEPESPVALVFMAVAFGLVHGIFASFMMIGLAERHPLKRFRERPIVSSLAHGFAHLVFGLAIGLTLLALRNSAW